MYEKDSFHLDFYRRFQAADAELSVIHALWERSLRHAVEDLPDVHMEPHPAVDMQTVLV